MQNKKQDFEDRFVHHKEIKCTPNYKYFLLGANPQNVWEWIEENFEPKKANPVDAVVSQAASQAVPEPNQQLFTIAEVEEFLQDQKYRCWKYYCDVWREIEDGIISNFHNAPQPQKFIDRIIVKS